MCFHGHNDRLGTAGSSCACTRRIVEHSKAHGNNFRFHLSNRRENIWVKRVGDRIVFKRIDDDLCEVFTAV